MTLARTALIVSCLALALAIPACTPASHAPPAPVAPAPSAAARDVTFLVTSDAHYDAFENEDRNDRTRDTIEAMNEIAGVRWPKDLGGDPIRPPRGVLMLGDMLDDGDRMMEGQNQGARQWAFYVADFGFDGTDGLLKYPVFEGVGNHDGPPAGREKFGFGFQAELKKRNVRRQEKGWLANLSENHLHYSWNWDGVHFVQLNLYPADKQHAAVKYSPAYHDPQGALTFLKQDLQTQVGTSRRPVVLLAHCGFETDWWHPDDWAALYAAAKPYNVILYMHGHTGTKVYTWKPPQEDRPLSVVNTGQTENGFFVVQITADRVRLAYRCKVWADKNPPKGTPRRWDGMWQWKHLLEKRP